MKKFYSFLYILILISCTSKTNKKEELAKEVVISGKVTDFNPDNRDISLAINRPGFFQLDVNTTIDSLGHFKASFETYTATDVWVSYETNFLIVVHPGDSINLEFDGKSQTRSTILKTIKFSGDNVKTNEDVAKFQELYYSHELYTNTEEHDFATKEYDVDDYILYLDTLQRKNNTFYKNFTSKTKPNTETKIWAKTYIDQDYYNALSFYPDEHRSSNNLKRKDWDVPYNYFAPLKKNSYINKSMSISGYSLSSFTNRFLSEIVYRNMAIDWNNRIDKKKKIDFDSLKVHSVLKYTPDNLTRELVLTAFFSQYLDANKLKIFEAHKETAEKHIKEPFLRDALFELYEKVKKRHYNPEIEANAFIKKVNNSSVKEVIDSIKSQNKGKVIYLDYWATWCAPCRKEMPNSKKLMNNFEGENVSFVYVCLDSKEDAWKASLGQFKLKGQHYFMTKQQSYDMRKLYEIRGIPYYILIGKNGEVIEKGSHLRPDVAQEQIEKLLK